MNSTKTAFCSKLRILQMSLGCRQIYREHFLLSNQPCHGWALWPYLDLPNASHHQHRSPGWSTIGRAFQLVLHQYLVVNLRYLRHEWEIRSNMIRELADYLPRNISNFSGARLVWQLPKLISYSVNVCHLFIATTQVLPFLRQLKSITSLFRSCPNAARRLMRRSWENFASGNRYEVTMTYLERCWVQYRKAGRFISTGLGEPFQRPAGSSALHCSRLFLPQCVGPVATHRALPGQLHDCPHLALSHDHHSLHALYTVGRNDPRDRWRHGLFPNQAPTKSTFRQWFVWLGQSEGQYKGEIWSFGKTSSHTKIRDQV